MVGILFGYLVTCYQCENVFSFSYFPTRWTKIGISSNVIMTWWCHVDIFPSRLSSRVHRLHCVQPISSPHVVLWDLMPAWRSLLTLLLT